MKSKKTLDSFVTYCENHPEERFWQALRNWSGSSFILFSANYDLETGRFEGIEDTFYKE